MNEEPTYNYVKGTGWVASMYDQVTRTAGKYTLTLLDKPPEPRDYYFTEYLDNERSMEDVLNHWVDCYTYQLDHGTISWHISRWAKRNRLRTDVYKYYTLKVEKIKPPKKPRAPRVTRPRQAARRARNGQQ